MFELIDIKNKVLKGLKKEWSTRDTSSIKDKSYYTLSFPLISLDFGGLLKYFSARTLGYWQNREGDYEVIGVESIDSFRNINSYKKINRAMEENPELVFIGGQRFDQDTAISTEWRDFGRQYYFLPMLVFERKDTSYQLKINFKGEHYASQVLQMSFLLQVENALRMILPRHGDWVVEESLDFQGPEHWNNMVNNALGELKKSNMSKIVLARKNVVTVDGVFEPSELFEKVCKNQTDTFRFFLQVLPGQAFMSVTPECLFKLRGKSVWIDALAGTRDRGRDENEDLALERELLQSEKDLREHNLVVNDIEERLRPWVDEIDKVARPKVLKLTNVQHMWTPMCSQLNQNVDVEKLISILHPTSAVGGSPWFKAREFINEQELMDRGWYAAPVGVISKGHTQFAVAIRSALAWCDQIHIYGGAGIVDGSEGEKEWKETVSKMQNFQKVL